jgi:hypothetical protein
MLKNISLVKVQQRCSMNTSSFIGLPSEILNVTSGPNVSFFNPLCSFSAEQKTSTTYHPESSRAEAAMKAVVNICRQTSFLEVGSRLVRQLSTATFLLNSLQV